MKLYLNTRGLRERIIPLWIDTDWQRRLWCLFRSHKNPHSARITDGHGNVHMTCGICGKVLGKNLGVSPSARPDAPNWNSKSWLWNNEPVTWYEFCDRLEGKGQ